MRKRDVVKGHKMDENYDVNNHAPLNLTCEKCGRRYCDCENKY